MLVTILRLKPFIRDVKTTHIVNSIFTKLDLFTGTRRQASRISAEYLLKNCTELSTQTNQFFIRMNCTTLLATTQSHHLPYLDISQTQQPYLELSKHINTIHAYGTVPLSIDLNKEYKCSKHHCHMRK